MSSSTVISDKFVQQTAAPVQNESKYYQYGSPSAAYKSSESFFAGVAKAVGEAVANIFKAIANAAIWVIQQFKKSPVESSDSSSHPNTEQELPDLKVAEVPAPAKAASKKFSKTKVAVGTAAAVLASVGIAHYLGYTQPADLVASGFNSARGFVNSIVNPYGFYA